LPIKVGNLLETPLIDLYEKSELLNALRNPQKISDGCEACLYAKVCRGGLKCLAYACTGNPFTKDPGCWLNEGVSKHREDSIWTRF
jgi:radical SAM protein with 4Fe4S-binding SPASM domain